VKRESGTSIAGISSPIAASTSARVGAAPVGLTSRASRNANSASAARMRIDVASRVLPDCTRQRS
jgi:hypothetical protein